MFILCGARMNVRVYTVTTQITYIVFIHHKRITSNGRLLLTILFHAVALFFLLFCKLQPGFYTMYNSFSSKKRCIYFRGEGNVTHEYTTLACNLVFKKPMQITVCSPANLCTLYTMNNYTTKCICFRDDFQQLLLPLIVVLVYSSTKFICQNKY